jgi:hypothetical protein
VPSRTGHPSGQVWVFCGSQIASLHLGSRLPTMRSERQPPIVLVASKSTIVPASLRLLGRVLSLIAFISAPSEVLHS